VGVVEQFAPRVGITLAGVTIRYCSTEMSPMVTNTWPAGNACTAG
jgi:hypothetical protein